MKIALFLACFFPLFSSAVTPVQTEIERTAILFFLESAHPATGLVLDKAPNFHATPASNRVASIASTGFGLAVLANAAKRNLIERELAEQQILKTLEFAQSHVPRERGWFLHWVDWETGARAWQSEYSPIDTALFMAGALYAAQIFPNGRIDQITRELYRDMDFHFFLTNNGTKPNKQTLSLSYTHEAGFAPYEWEIYAEQHILLLLGLAHPTRPLPFSAWKGWKRFNSVEALYSRIMGYEMPLFVHQYSQVFFDFRGFNEGLGDYFQNGVRATLLHRHMLTTAKKFKTFAAGYWGVSAGEDPAGYKVWDPTRYEGTVCIGCTLASVMYTPFEVLSDIDRWYKGPHKEQIWGRYGFVDSINLDRNWFSQNVLGITVGPAYMSFANIKPETSIWQDFMKIPEIKLALKRAKGQ